MQYYGIFGQAAPPMLPTFTPPPPAAEKTFSLTLAPGQRRLLKMPGAMSPVSYDADVPDPPVGRPNGFSPGDGPRDVPGKGDGWWESQPTGTKVAIGVGGALVLGGIVYFVV